MCPQRKTYLASYGTQLRGTPVLGKQHSAEGAHCVPGAVDQPIGAAHYAGAHQQNPVEEHNLLWSTPGTQLRKHALFEHIDGTESKRVTLLENM